MTLLLDTSTLPAADRPEAVAQAMQTVGVPARLIHDVAPCDVHARIETWQLGAGVTVLHRESSGLRLTRTPAQIRVAGPERVALSVLSAGRWSYTQNGHTRTADATVPQMVLTDHSAAYEFNRVGDGATRAVNIDRAVLGIPSDTIRSAVVHLESSPLYGLVLTHVLEVSRELDLVPAGPGTSMLGASVTELIRALIITAASNQGVQETAAADTLALRLTLYLQKHFTDHELTPARIAHHHHISVRQLYSVWAKDNELSLAQWLMNERLEAARRLLAKPGSQSQTIASIAMRCGFTDTTHFARRFRGAYGLSPRSWRQLNTSTSP